MKKTSCVSKYKEVFIETTTKKECVAIMKKYEKKGYTALKPMTKELPGDDSGLFYHLFMKKETEGYIDCPPTDITVLPQLIKNEK